MASQGLSQTNYPLVFSSETVAHSGTRAAWETHSERYKSEVSVPVEFKGPGLALSPEDLFNHALTNCFVATFKVYAENSKLEYSEIRVSSKLLVDFDETKKLVMKSLHVDAKILGATNPEKALLLAKKAAASGFILNSVKTELVFSFETQGA